MKIVFLGGNFDHSGGTERVATIIANQLAEAGHEVVVASLSRGQKPFFPLHQSIIIKSLFENEGRTLRRAPLLVYRLRKLLKAEQPDALVAVESMLALFTVPATSGLKLKHICWEHFNFKSDLGKKGRNLARQLAAKYCDVVVTLTERDREYWRKGTKGRAEIVTIPNPSPFPVQPIDDIATKQNVVLAVGRLAPQKGFDLLLRAWQGVFPRVPDWTLRIVGEGEQRDVLSKMATDLGIDQAVEFVGQTSDVGKYYRQASLFCLSSRFEGFPMVLLETLSFGLPVVSFDCDTGPAEVLAGTGAILVPEGKVDDLGEALVNLIKSPKERQRIAARSHEKAQQYQINRVINDWIKLIERDATSTK